VSKRKLQIKPQEVEAWHDRVRYAEEYIEENHLPKWKSIYNEYSGNSDFGEYGLGYGDDDENININFLLSTSNSILPAIVSADPFIKLKPRRSQDKESAKKGQVAVQYAWREGECTESTREVATDALMFGVGIGKVGYDPAGAFYTEEDYDVGPEIEEDSDDGLLDNEAKRALSRALAEEMLIMDDGPVDNPTLERVAPWNLLVPPGYNEVRKCPWVAERMTVRLEELRADDRFIVPSKLKPNEWLMDGIPERLTPEGDGLNGTDKPKVEPEYVSLYEIRYWSRSRKGTRRRILWLVNQQDGVTMKETVVRHIDDPLMIRGYPYIDMRFVKAPGAFYSTKISDIAMIKDLASRLNEEWDHILAHHRRARNRKYAVISGLLESNEVQAVLESSQDMECFEVPASLQRAGDAIFPVPVAEPPQTTHLVLNGLQKLIYEMSGIDVYQRGGTGRKGTTATEVAISSRATQGRAAYRVRAIDKFIKAVARHMVAIQRQYWDEPRYLRVAGAGGEDDFVVVSGEDITGQFDVEVEIGSMMPSDPASEQRAYLGLLSTIQQTAATIAPMIQNGLLPPDALKNFMDKAFSVWAEDKKALVGPLSELQAMPGMGGQGGGQGGPVGPENVQDQGMGPGGESLAGSGPKPRPGQQAAPGPGMFGGLAGMPKGSN